MPDDQQLTLERLNAAPAEQLRETLRACCASDAWVDQLLAHRPFADRAAALAGSDTAMGDIADADVDQALAGHPRIGDRAEGEGTDARWSREEQASVADAGDDVQQQLRDGNLSYERRFDRVFLIRAAGRSPQEMLTELTRRLDQDDETERAEVREQLRQITRLRLERALSPTE